MLDNLIDPVVREYLLLDSRLRTFGGKFILAVIVAVLAVLAYLGWGVLTSKNTLFEVWIWVPYSILGSTLAYLVIAFLDRERRVRFFHFFVLVTVVLLTAPPAAYFNEISPFKLWTVGFNEEAFKILPVLFLAIYLPNLIRTRKDGILYGALAGMGFNIIEIGAYIATQLHSNTLSEAVMMHSTRLGLWGFGGHIIWSAFIGLGIGFAAESSHRGWKKWNRAVIFYLLAALAHSLYDLGGSALGFMPVVFLEALIRTGDISAFDLSGAGGTPGPLNDGMRYGTYLYNLVFVVVLIVQTRRSFRLENEIQIAELSAEEEPVITADELTQLKGERLFLKRHYRNFSKQVGAKIVLYQNLLAMQKHTVQQLALPTEKTRALPLLRGAIASLRKA